MYMSVCAYKYMYIYVYIYSHRYICIYIYSTVFKDEPHLFWPPQIALFKRQLPEIQPGQPSIV